MRFVPVEDPVVKLVVFDIDGTLTLGDGLGTHCFFSAFEETFGAAGFERRLEGYAESTDAGIAIEAAERALGRAPEDHEIAAFRHAYLARLEREIRARRSAYRAVPGAAEVMGQVARRGWSVALATGNWRRAASLKLESARIQPPPVAACAEEGVRRPDVLGAAIRLASGHYGSRGFERVVYVGDQPWDLAAASEVGAGFVGIGDGERAKGLRARGARVVDDYGDAGGFLDRLEEAAEAVVTPGVRRD